MTGPRRFRPVRAESARPERRRYTTSRADPPDPGWSRELVCPHAPDPHLDRPHLVRVCLCLWRWRPRRGGAGGHPPPPVPPRGGGGGRPPLGSPRARPPADPVGGGGTSPPGGATAGPP